MYYIVLAIMHHIHCYIRNSLSGGQNIQGVSRLAQIAFRSIVCEIVYISEYVLIESCKGYYRLLQNSYIQC